VGRTQRVQQGIEALEAPLTLVVVVEADVV
jgi:hypothetical protein